jgi:FixJ family two-component response regulator
MKQTIFVIDDELPVRRTVSHLLASAGYDVQDFDSAERFSPIDILPVLPAFSSISGCQE